ncbi:hypothetical protein QBC39DRAFT_370067 [Podospora conica]|nr:hypothetical protein QBC39DRAFT_370067 [Schizothecium conicum]
MSNQKASNLNTERFASNTTGRTSSTSSFDSLPIEPTADWAAYFAIPPTPTAQFGPGEREFQMSFSASDTDTGRSPSPESTSASGNTGQRRFPEPTSLASSLRQWVSPVSPLSDDGTNPNYRPRTFTPSPPSPAWFMANSSPPASPSRLALSESDMDDAPTSAPPPTRAAVASWVQACALQHIAPLPVDRYPTAEYHSPERSRSVGAPSPEIIGAFPSESPALPVTPVDAKRKRSVGDDEGRPGPLLAPVQRMGLFGPVYVEEIQKGPGLFGLRADGAKWCWEGGYWKERECTCEQGCWRRSNR